MDEHELEGIETERLLAELNRRRTGDKSTLQELELTFLEHNRQDDLAGYQQQLESWSEQETLQKKPCPRCGHPTAVHGGKRERTVMTVQGSVTLRRNYHYCARCRGGFCPLDETLGLPAQGQVSRLCQQRIVDFAVNDSYEQGCERFAFHYGFSVSTCLMRRVVERVPMPEYARVQEATPQEVVTIGVDGSMVPMRQGWQECKLATVVKGSHHSRAQGSRRGQVSQASYVATMGKVDAFEAHLKKVIPPRIPVKRRPHTPAPQLVWLGDGAPWIWNLKKRLAPTATAILDWVHGKRSRGGVGESNLETTDPSENQRLTTYEVCFG